MACHIITVFLLFTVTTVFGDPHSSIVHESYKPLCQRKEYKVDLFDEFYDYYPDSYVEYKCYSPHGDMFADRNQMCLYPGFSCVQQKEKIPIMKRAKGTQDWSFFDVERDSDCSCMVPEQTIVESFHEKEVIRPNVFSK